MSSNLEEREFYKQNGYILLQNIFSEQELDECSQAYDTLFKLKSQEKGSNMEATWGGDWKNKYELSEGKTSVLSIHNLQCHYAIFTKMLLNDNLLSKVSTLIESRNILLHHTKAHLKPPSVGSPFPTHQDYHYFPFKNHTMVAIFICLDDCEPSNGGLVVFPGSHKLGPLTDHSNNATNHYVDQEKFSLDKGVPICAKKGDVIIFSYLLVHGSYPNVSSRNRRMLLIQVVAAEDEPIEEVHVSLCQGMVLKGANVKMKADLNKIRLIKISFEPSKKFQINVLCFFAFVTLYF